jgi:hypothetical protein
VLDTPLLLPGPNKRRHGGFSRLVDTVGLNQKEFAISEPEEGLTTLRISASAEHFFTAFCSAKNNLAEQLDAKISARRMP